MKNEAPQQKVGEFMIPEPNMGEFNFKMNKIQKKLARLGLPTLEIEAGAPVDVAFVKKDGHWQKYQDSAKPLAEYEREGLAAYRRYFPVVLLGQVPRLAGWTFVATLQHLRDEETGNMINMLRTVPTFEGELPKGYRTASPENCDHCHKRIRSRRETFILRHDNGTWQQVGRNCTQDFLGGADPHLVAQHLELLLQASALGGADEEGFGGGGGGGLYRLALRTFLGVVAMLVRSEGWVSRGRARESDGALEATAELAFQYLTPPPRDPRAREEHLRWVAAHPVLEEDVEVADKAFDYAREDLAEKGEARNDYEHNLYVACSQSSIDHRLTGIAASLIPYYLREIERRVLREIELRRTANSEYVGAVKERLLINVQVIKIITIGDEDSIYGMRYLHKLADRAGNALTWFSSNAENNLKPGETCWVMGTVKKHDEYRGIKQTTLNRLAKLTDEEAAAEQEKRVKKAARAVKKAAKAAQTTT